MGHSGLFPARALRLILILFVTAFFPACATDMVVVEYYSDPPGASIYQGDEFKGHAPVAVFYEVKREWSKDGYFFSPPITARWVSGATATQDKIRINVQRDLQKVSLIRPEGAPDLELDVNYALEMEKIHLKKEAKREKELGKRGMEGEPAKLTDTKCLDDCSRNGYSYQYCRKFCSY